MSERLAFPAGELRRRTARGAVLNAGFLGGAEGLSLVQGLLATALLGPSQIGLYGVVSVTAMTIVGLRRVGMDEAFVQQEEPDQEREFQLAFTVELALGAVAAALIVAMAPLVAVVYDDNRLLALTLAVSYLPIAFALQAPQWVFLRRMDFLRVRVLHALVPVVSFFVTVPLILAGVGVWALVIGPAAGALMSVVAGLAVSPYPLALRPSRGAARRYLRFSGPIFVSALLVLIVDQGQIAAFGISDGIAAAGFITVATTLTRYADRADQWLTATIYPAICAVRGRIAVLTELFEKSNRLTLMWALPFGASFLLFSGDLVDRVLGPEWRPAVPLLAGLAVVVSAQQVGFNWFSFYRAHGRAAPHAVESAALLAGVAAFAIPGLLIWGFTGFVIGRGLAAVGVLAVRRRYIHALLPGVRLAALAARAVLPVALAAAPVVALRVALWGRERTLPQLALELALWGAGLAWWSWRLERPLLSEVRAQFGRRALAVGEPPAAQLS
jgi:O-antigen/teichoic acid export membrane protein